MATYLAGFSLGLSFILAIGSQNAFVLKQGLRGQHVLVVSAVCAISDALLISLGVAGFGAMVTQFPNIELFARYGGALFLVCYALLSFRSALTRHQVLSTQGEPTSSTLSAVLTCLAFTWLNPHVYLDTLVLLGSVSTQYQPEQFVFAAGAISASLVFFFSLGYGARLLAPLFNKPQTWKILEVIVGIIMLIIACSLIAGASS